MRYATTQYQPTRFTPRGHKRAAYELAAAGLPGYIPSGPVRGHIAKLVALNMPMTSIARDAGCTKRALQLIARGEHASVRTRYAAAIMAVNFHPNERQGNVLAVGAIRRARALHAIGWTWVALAEHTPGVSSGALAQVTHPHRARILIAWTTWATIRDAYEKLSGTPAPTGRTVLARNHSRQHGWAPPLDWEDHDIDDPRVTVKPSGTAKGVALREIADQRREQVGRLTRAGRSTTEIAVQLGITPRHVTRYRSEANTNTDMLYDDDEMSA